MTVKDLREALESYDDGAHVVVAMMPDAQLLIPREGRKFEVHDAWCDGHGVLNIIATTQACEVDPSLRSENEL